MKILSAIGGGLAGALAVTLIHEVVKRVDSEAPRMDLLGMDALSKILRHSEQPVPSEDKLFKATLAGDIISNAAYYSFAVARNKKVWTSGSLLGLAAGIGAVVLPKYIGLNPAHSNKTAKTQILTTSLYLAGGLIASAVAKSLDKKR
ncbi:hypothetical protein [Arcticibacter sp. MXS-1]|uniref:hypothetical protein n=1 Tax=Arcticibacter sp. MXS-1 TaxID=3341726 RepID=UPI0035A842D7